MLVVDLRVGALYTRNAQSLEIKWQQYHSNSAQLSLFMEYLTFDGLAYVHVADDARHGKHQGIPSKYRACTIDEADIGKKNGQCRYR
jgi:hypothetical protein